MTKILRSIYLDEEKVARLIKLSKITRVPQQVYIREGIDMVLAKREKRSKRKRTIREEQ